MIKVVVLVDNVTISEKYLSAHGLSLYIEYGNTYLLFDLGPNEKILQHNMEKLDIDPGLIDATIISHAHADHVGGIPYIGWVSPYLPIYIPYGSMQTLGKISRSHGLKPDEVTNWQNPWPGIYISKPIHGPPWEHFLVITTSNGLVVFSGCMHPGIENTLDVIAEYFNTKHIYGIIGGFHLVNAPERIVYKTIDYLINKYHVEKIIPLHCSGDLIKSILRRDYPDKYVEAGVGSIIGF